MLNELNITEHMEVVDASGTHIGTVDAVSDGEIKLTRNDSVDGQHHYVPMSAADRVEDGRLILATGAPMRMSEAQVAAASEHHVTVAAPAGGAGETPLFGTSGTGTGMGGSGRGEH